MDNRAENYDDSCFSENHEKIAALNDNLRKTFSGGNVMTSSGIVALGPKRKWEIIKQVKEFNEFDFRNDPYGEHDFGAIYDGNDEIFWKIDYYDKNFEFASVGFGPKFIRIGRKILYSLNSISEFEQMNTAENTAR